MLELDELIRSYYKNQSLSEGKIENLISLKKKSPMNRMVFRYMRMGLAAAVAVVVLLVFSHYLELGNTKRRVLQEVVMNHKKGLSVEVATKDYHVLQEKMDRLDFSILPVAESRFLKNYLLLGGRYCSIQGNLAAQLKVRDKITGKIATLYISRPVATMGRFSGEKNIVDRVEIALWNGELLFFALAINTTNQIRNNE